MKKPSSNLFNSPFSGFFMGMFFFISVFGFKILNPTYADWLFTGDSAQHYLGWEFFRNESWKNPLGLISSYGIPDGSSVVYTDSIPLLAIFFKIFKSILPQPFQYFGFWLLLCYVLQGFFGWRLSARISDRILDRWIISLFFIISPIILLRVTDHQSLAGQWLILVALDFYWGTVEELKLKPGHLPFQKRWIGLIVITGMIHFYLLVMVLGLYMAACLSFMLTAPQKAKTLINMLVSPFVFLIPVMYETGSFILTPNNFSTDGAESFGNDSMNLLAPFNPMKWDIQWVGDYYSLFMKPYSVAFPYQCEGFNYWGIGFLFLLLVLLVLLVTERISNKRSESKERKIPMWPLALIAVIFTLYAISTKVTLADHLLFVIPMPNSVLKFFTVFRSSGRFFWLPYYLTMFVVFKELCKKTIKISNSFSAFLLMALILQLLDFSLNFKNTHHHFHHLPSYNTPLQSVFWKSTMQNKKIILYYPLMDYSYFAPLGLVAADSGASINVAYRSRANYQNIPGNQDLVLNEIMTGKLRSDALYVFKDDSVYTKAKKQKSNPNVFLGCVDGFYVSYLK